MSPQNDLVDLVSNIKRQSWGLGLFKSLPKSLSSQHVASSTRGFYRPLPGWCLGRTEMAWSRGSSARCSPSRSVADKLLKNALLSLLRQPRQSSLRISKALNARKADGMLVLNGCHQVASWKMCVFCAYGMWFYKMCYALGNSVRIKMPLLLWVISKV